MFLPRAVIDSATTSWTSKVRAILATISSCIFEQVGEGFVETFGPQVAATFRFGQLHIYPKAASTTLHRALEYVADVELATNLIEIR